LNVALSDHKSYIFNYRDLIGSTELLIAWLSVIFDYTLKLNYAYDVMKMLSPDILFRRMVTRSEWNTTSEQVVINILSAYYYLKVNGGGAGCN
jgi:hypothetical protein